MTSQLQSTAMAWPPLASRADDARPDRRVSIPDNHKIVELPLMALAIVWSARGSINAVLSRLARIWNEFDGTRIEKAGRVISVGRIGTVSRSAIAIAGIGMPVVRQFGPAVVLCAGLALGLICLGASISVAQSGTDTRKLLDTAAESLKAKRESEKGLLGDVEALTVERELLNSSLLDTAKKIQSSEGRLTSIEDRLGELEAQEKLLRGSLAERHGSIARLLSAMQRMGRDPPPVMITRREDALVMVRSAMMLARSFPHLKDQALALAARLDDLARVMGESRAEGEKLRTESQRLTEARVRLSQLMEEKRVSLSSRQASLDRVRREAEEIAKSVSDLSELIEKLDVVITKQAGPALAAVEPSAPAVAQPNVSEPATRLRRADDTSTPLPPAPVPEGPKTIELAPKGPRIASLNAGRISPAMPFENMRARLPYPVQGRRIIGFGDKAQANKSSGVVFETRPGAQVVSPADGWIVFAGPFRSYGQILIINAGGGYHMLLAGLAQADVQLGQFVLAGEPVGLMSGLPKDRKAKAPSSTAVLYVELRKDSKPIDPEPWWAIDNTKKVQG